MQRTIQNEATFEGIGLHSGAKVHMVVKPADVNFGIHFYRVDAPAGQQHIPALFDRVNDTRLNTRISNAHGVYVSTIEHLMAALAGMGITNARVEIDGPEVPVLDGSSKIYVEKFWKIGVVDQDCASRVLKVVKSVEVRGDKGAYAALHPNAEFVLDVDIDFADPIIGHQALSLNMANGVFVRELADCRTFTRFFEVETLQKNGLALGGSLENAVVVDNGLVLNPEGFRRPDECVRHKMLDALGDLYLGGGAIIGRYEGHLSGHALTNQLLRKAFAENAFRMIDSHSPQNLDAMLPGFELEASDFATA